MLALCRLGAERSVLGRWYNFPAQKYSKHSCHGQLCLRLTAALLLQEHPLETRERRVGHPGARAARGAAALGRDFFEAA